MVIVPERPAPAGAEALPGVPDAPATPDEGTAELEHAVTTTASAATATPETLRAPSRLIDSIQSSCGQPKRAAFPACRRQHQRRPSASRVPGVNNPLALR